MTAQAEISECRPWRTGPSIYCCGEWHLRKNPRAIAIYNLALRLSNGSKAFFLSQPQVAQYFDWSLSAVKYAFRVLEKSGLFVLTQKGRGGDVRCENFANVYQVRTHNELPKDGNTCWVKPEKRPRVKNDPRSENSQGGKRPEKRPAPRVENDPSPRVKNDPLVVDLSSKKSSSSDAGASGAQSSASPTRTKKTKSSELPDDFTPNDENRALANKLGVDLKESLLAFKDYHLHKGDRGKDWNLSLNGWLRNESKFSRPQPKAPAVTGSATANLKALLEKYH